MDGNRMIVDWLKKNKITYSNLNDTFELEVGSIGFNIQLEFNDEKIYAMHIFFNTEDSWDNLYERLIFSDDAPNKDIEGYLTQELYNALEFYKGLIKGIGFINRKMDEIIEKCKELSIPEDILNTTLQDKFDEYKLED